VHDNDALQPGSLRPPRLLNKSNTRYLAKLYVNGHLVGRTKGVVLGEGFAATFNELFR